MEITQIPVSKLTNEEFIESYKEDKIKFKLQGSRLNFDSLLHHCLQKGIITMERTIELQKLLKQLNIINE